jgi:hypothetical protein
VVTIKAVDITKARTAALTTTQLATTTEIRVRGIAKTLAPTATSPTMCAVIQTHYQTKPNAPDISTNPKMDAWS